MEGKVNNASLSTRAPGPPRHESEAGCGSGALIAAGTRDQPHDRIVA